MTQFVAWFGYTPARLSIINGLLDYRAQLLGLGITGFQWLSGSFVEKIEDTQRRDPVDVDVVTIFTRPVGIDDAGWQTFLDGPNGYLINDSQAVKARFRCDAYSINLNEEPIDVVDQTRYWFGLFSHQRFTSFWKGMLAVELDAQQDAAARGMISTTHP
ncbi:hypothetical protein LRS06_07120 [Hymenobacter sp. J193]|nr:hypothetical protein [Hymenobacter sp. J193]MCR5887550.1 hypothetical protein [Hymenobacter sp. J193]